MRFPKASLFPSTAALALLFFCDPAIAAGRRFIRGDSNGDTKVDISDAIRTLGFLFSGDEKPANVDAADANDDSKVDISDPIATLGFLFLGNGASLPPPFPNAGFDPTTDDLVMYPQVMIIATVPGLATQEVFYSDGVHTQGPLGDPVYGDPLDTASLAEMRSLAAACLAAAGVGYEVRTASSPHSELHSLWVLVLEESDVQVEVYRRTEEDQSLEQRVLALDAAKRLVMRYADPTAGY